MNSFKNILSRGVFYIALAKYSNVLFSIVIGAILARLLTPDDFGIVAIVTVFVTFFNMLTNFGFGPAVVQNQNLTKEDISSIFVFTIFLGFVFAAIFFLSAKIIANFYDIIELVSIVKALSFSVLFFSLQIIPYALSQKALKFKQIGIISLSVQIFSGIVAVVLAYKGFSYNALVIRSMLNSILLFAIFYLIEPIKITLKINFSSIKKIIRFSSFQFFFNIINYFSRNADNILIGKYFGSDQLGFYDKSYQLMLMPVQNLTHVISPVLMPVLSKYQDNLRIVYENYLKVVRLLAIIGFPLSISLFFMANEIIQILYGPQWIQSIPVFELLALTVGLQIVMSSIGSIYQTANRTDLLFLSGLLSAVFTIGGISYGIFIGKTLLDIGYGLIMAFLISFIIGYYILIRFVLNGNVWCFIKVLINPIIYSFIMLFVGLIFNSFMTGIGLVFSLVLKMCVFGIIYFIQLVISKDISDLKSLIKNIKSK